MFCSIPATLHLDGNSFSGSFPGSIGNCSQLREIRLDQNAFHGAIPTEIGKLEWLGKFAVTWYYLMSLAVYILDEGHWFVSFHESQNANMFFSSRSPTNIPTVSFSLEGNSFTGVMPDEVCKLRDGHSGILESLSATCAAETVQERNQEVFERHNDFVCRVPDCCTSCELRV